MHGNLELTNTKESFTRSPSVAYGASSLPEGAFNTRISSLSLYLLSVKGKAFMEPRDASLRFRYTTKAPDGEENPSGAFLKRLKKIKRL